MRRKTSRPASSPESRFWEKVRKTEYCWNWTAATTKGYGIFGHVPGKTIKAHRYVWTMTFGLIPNKLHVCHKCDNRACVRPDHLFLGTNEDNHKDKVAKGRHRWGERHQNAKVTDAQVLEIRRLGREKGLRQEDIGKIFGIGRQAVGKIINGRRRRRAS